MGKNNLSHPGESMGWRARFRAPNVIAGPPYAAYLPGMLFPARFASRPAFMVLLMGLAAGPEPRGQTSLFTGIPFQSDLENLDSGCFATRAAAGCGGWLGIHDQAISLGVGEKNHSGKQALRIEFIRNEDYAATWRKTEGRHIFTRFYDYYDSGFDFAAGMKIHHLSAFNEVKQINDYDIILQLKADEPGADYCGMTDAKWLALTFNGGPVDWGSVEARFTPMRGRWYCIETEVRLNTPGLSDGEARIWVDGQRVAERTGMNLTGTVASPINRALFGGWYSNSAAGKNRCPDPVTPSRRYVDDAAIAGSYIGMITGTPIPPITPIPPGPIIPRKPPHRPRNLPAHEYDPIPD